MGLVLLTGAQLVTLWQQVQPPSAAQEAEARRFYEDARADWEANGEQYVADCLAAQEQEREATGRVVDFGCEDMEPRLEQFLWQAPPFTESLGTGLSGLAMVVIVVAVLAGGTFVAAEHAAGSLATWLTFVPLRARVYTSKVLAAAVGVVPAVAVAVVVHAAGSWALHDAQGLTAGLRPEHWADAAGIGGRLVAAGALAALVGAALGFLLRHTAAVLGAALVWLLVIDTMLGQALQGRLQPWLLNANLRGFVDGGTTWDVEECAPTADGLVCEWVEHELSLGQATGYVLLVAVVLATAGLLAFRRRDVA